jgi:ankyrin repeat protein
LGKVDSKASPLVAAAEEGREKVAVTLLGASGIDINQATTEGMSPLCAACELVHEHIVDHLLAAGGINTEHMLKNGATALSIAASRGNVKIIESVVFDLQRNVGIKLSMDMFPVRDQFESSVAYREAVVAWAVVNCGILHQ